MTTYTHALDADRSASLNAREALIGEVQCGLLRRPRSLAPWMFYDAYGSRLFERITQLPEYYPTRVERNILSSFADPIISAANADKAQSLRLLELGAGTASKTDVILHAIVRTQGGVLYIPMDISPEALVMARERIGSRLPEVCVEPVVANYVTHPPQIESFDGTTLAMYIGSSIGNFSPGEARTILKNLNSQLQVGDALLLGTDMAKDESTLMAAYDDTGSITAAFNLNLLHRLNRELDANFDTANFRHLARWNREESRIEMHLESTRRQCVRIAAAHLDLHFEKRETIHTENSYKFTFETIRILLEDAGFDVEQTWTDDRRWYAVTLARVHAHAGKAIQDERGYGPYRSKMTCLDYYR